MNRECLWLNFIPQVDVQIFSLNVLNSETESIVGPLYFNLIACEGISLSNADTCPCLLGTLYSACLPERDIWFGCTLLDK